MFRISSNNPHQLASVPTWSVLFGRRDSQNDTLLSRAPCAVSLYGLLSCLDFDHSYWVRVMGTHVMSITAWFWLEIAKKWVFFSAAQLQTGSVTEPGYGLTLSLSPLEVHR